MASVVAFVQPQQSAAASRTARPSQLYNAPEPLATEGEWTAFLDEDNTGVVYYFNTRTGESLWEPPTTTFPEVYLKPSKRRKAEAKRAAYYKQMNEAEGKKGFLGMGGEDVQMINKGLK